MAKAACPASVTRMVVSLPFVTSTLVLADAMKMQVECNARLAPTGTITHLTYNVFSVNAMTSVVLRMPVMNQPGHVHASSMWLVANVTLA